MTAVAPLTSAFDDRGRATYDYSPRATDPGPLYNPPVPGTPGFSRVKGRSGDLIIIQLRSMNGEKQKRRDAVRSIGLKGPDSAILRSSSDEALWGNIEAVRDIIAVVILPRRAFAVGADARSEDSALTYDSLKYGTNTRPGHLWRAFNGSYFASEFERSVLLCFWNTDLTFAEALGKFAGAGLVIDKHSTDGQVVQQLADGSPALVTDRGSWPDLAERIEPDRLARAVIPLKHGTRVVWHTSLKRFHDIEAYQADISITSVPPDVVATRALVQATAPGAFLDHVPCHITARINGRMREYPIEPQE